MRQETQHSWKRIPFRTVRPNFSTPYMPQSNLVQNFRSLSDHTHDILKQRSKNCSHVIVLNTVFIHSQVIGLFVSWFLLPRTFSAPYLLAYFFLAENILYILYFISRCRAIFYGNAVNKQLLLLLLLLLIAILRLSKYEQMKRLHFSDLTSSN